MHSSTPTGGSDESVCASGRPTLAGLIEQAAKETPDRVAVAGPDRDPMTYEVLITSSRQLGRALLARGASPGDRVAVWLEDSPEYVQIYVACALAGLVVVPINRRFTTYEARHIVTDCGARMLVFDPSSRTRARELAGDLLDLDLLLVATKDKVSEETDLLSLADLESTAPLPGRQPADPVIIGYTSGTTGPPKGAVLTHGSVAAIARMNAESYRLPAGSVAVMTGSMSFVAVVPAHIMSHFYVCGTVRFLGKWTVESALEAVERYQATFLYVPSPLVDEFARAFAAQPQRGRTLTTVLHSGSKVASENLTRLAEAVGVRLVEGWGMTENSGGLMTATSPDDADPKAGRLGTVGRAVRGVEVEIIDPQGRSLDPDGFTVGELAFRSPALMTGYWNRPADTAAVLVDGWYRSGDVGTIDKEGYVTLIERRVDLITSGGMNVYPYEVEQVLLSNDAVAQACVVGVPHERWGQGVVAAVVLRAGAPADADALREYCRAFLAGYKVPIRIEFLSQLPMTSSLKVSRAVVRAQLRRR